MLESALLDVDPDDAMELNRKKRIMRWDAKKRKFVKVRTHIDAHAHMHARTRSQANATITLVSAYSMFAVMRLCPHHHL